MNGNAQPALLYLVPFTLIPPLIIATFRKEFKQLWNGPETHFSLKKNSTNKSESIEDVNREDNQLIENSRSSIPSNSS
jgi:hypothetical protein